MAKTKISQYDSTAANNTDINSINIAEGMAPSDVNNAIRELMAELKNFQAGTSGDDVTVGGALSVTGNATLSNTLTANASVGTTGQVLFSRGAASSPQWGDPAAHFRNLLINGGFTINQRAYVSAAVLASGVYGHDRWKAGASGGDYSFTQLASNTQITIASGKSLIQVVEDKNVQASNFILSWTGTAQARVGINSATPSGSYAASPIVITGQTAGTTMSVEFNTGTLSKVQLEANSVATPFDTRSVGQEMALCQRYLWRGIYPTSLNFSSYASGSVLAYPIKFGATMRAVPTLTSDFTGNTASGISSLIFDLPTVEGARLILTSNTVATNVNIAFAASNYLQASSEL